MLKKDFILSYHKPLHMMKSERVRKVIPRDIFWICINYAKWKRPPLIRISYGPNLIRSTRMIWNPWYPTYLQYLVVLIHYSSFFSLAYRLVQQIVGTCQSQNRKLCKTGSSYRLHHTENKPIVKFVCQRTKFNFLKKVSFTDFGRRRRAMTMILLKFVLHHLPCIDDFLYLYCSHSRPRPYTSQSVNTKSWIWCRHSSILLCNELKAAMIST